MFELVVMLFSPREKVRTIRGLSLNPSIREGTAHVAPGDFRNSGTTRCDERKHKQTLYITYGTDETLQRLERHSFSSSSPSFTALCPAKAADTASPSALCPSISSF